LIASEGKDTVCGTTGGLSEEYVVLKLRSGYHGAGKNCNGKTINDSIVGK
jgi:hypothetical protein